MYFVGEEAKKNWMIAVRSALYGFSVADALGVPVEFELRDILKKNPVVGMEGYGTYCQPPGTWSDDSSMMLALAYSIAEKNGIDVDDIMERFYDWYKNGAYSPFGKCFDIGTTTIQAIFNYEKGIPPISCGASGSSCNGNGSLMRILPLAFALYPSYKTKEMSYDQILDVVHMASGLTHGHPIAKSACGIYITIALLILDGVEMMEAIYTGINTALSAYRNSEFSEYMNVWNRLGDPISFSRLSVDEIKSSGFVVDTLEAAIWCLQNTFDYKECVLKAVNLGGDTDTIAAIAGGLAGIVYGFCDIPSEWIDALANKKIIDDACRGLVDYIESQ